MQKYWKRKESGGFLQMFLWFNPKAVGSSAELTKFTSSLYFWCLDPSLKSASQTFQGLVASLEQFWVHFKKENCLNYFRSYWNLTQSLTTPYAAFVHSTWICCYCPSLPHTAWARTTVMRSHHHKSLGKLFFLSKWNRYYWSNLLDLLLLAPRGHTSER